MTYEETRPWAQVDQGARGRAPDAAVAHRQDRRHPALQERPLAVRRARSTPSSAGSMRGAPQGRPEGHAAAEEVRQRRRVELRRVSSAGRRISSSSRRRTRCRAQALDQWYKPVVETGLTEAALGARDRDPSGHREGPPGHASRAGAAAAGRHPDTEPARSDRRRGAGLFMEWAVGKQGEIMRAEQRQADAARLEDHLRGPLSRGRRGDHRSGRARHLLLSERAGAEVSPGARVASAASPAARATSTSRRTARS